MVRIGTVDGATFSKVFGFLNKKVKEVPHDMSQVTLIQDRTSRLIEYLSRYGLLMAVVVGLIVRITMTTALVPWNEVPWRYDDASYAKYAIETLRLGRLDTHHFPVGYPLFVALCLKLSGGAFAAVRIANVLIGTLTIIMVSRVSSLLYGAAAGIAAAWFTALYPPLSFLSSRVMSETLFIGILIPSVYFLVESERSLKVWHGVLGLCLFAIASLVRSNLLAMFAFLPLWLLTRRAVPIRRRLIIVSVGMALVGAILLAPGLYFLKTKGEFIPLATNAGQTFYGANNPLADGGWVQVEDHQELLSTIPPSVRKSPQAYSKAQNQLAIAWIRENPKAFIALLPKKFANAWLPGFQKSQTTSDSRLVAALLATTFGLLLVAAVVGRMKIKPAFGDGTLVAILVTYTALSLVFYGNPRIGVYCAPVLIIYASSILPLIKRSKFWGSFSNAAKKGSQLVGT
jgi:hypothetical protein